MINEAITERNYEAKYFDNYALKFSLFEEQQLIKFNSELARKINFLPTRFERNNRLFVKGNVIYIDVISILGWLSGSWRSEGKKENRENRGYFKDLFNGIMENGYDLIVTNPMGMFNVILKKYGFRKFTTDSDNYYDEPVEVYYFTQEMRNLPVITSGCLGFAKEEDSFVFWICDENKEVLFHHFSDLGDNYDIAFDSITSALNQLHDDSNNKHPQENKIKFKTRFPDGFLLRFLPTLEKRHLFKEWLEAK